MISVQSQGLGLLGFYQRLTRQSFQRAHDIPRIGHSQIYNSRPICACLVSAQVEHAKHQNPESTSDVYVWYCERNYALPALQGSTTADLI